MLKDTAEANIPTVMARSTKASGRGIKNMAMAEYLLKTTFTRASGSKE